MINWADQNLCSEANSCSVGQEFQYSTDTWSSLTGSQEPTTYPSSEPDEFCKQLTFYPLMSTLTISSYRCVCLLTQRSLCFRHSTKFLYYPLLGDACYIPYLYVPPSFYHRSNIRMIKSRSGIWDIKEAGNLNEDHMRQTEITLYSNLESYIISSIIDAPWLPMGPHKLLDNFFKSYLELEMCRDTKFMSSTTQWM
jgi:hypothetical protein